MTTRIALVTGGSRGLGRAAALALAADGADIVLTYRTGAADAAKTVTDVEALGRKAAALPLDLAHPDAVAPFVERLRATLASRFGATQLHALMNTHFRGPFFLTQSLMPLIADGGRILNVSSGLTRFSLPGYAAYAAMKGAVEVMTRYLAKELGPRGISVNCIAPGAIETDFGGGRVRDDSGLNQFVASITALGRAGQPEDIGPVMAALLGEGTHWINGQRVEASGGMFL